MLFLFLLAQGGGAWKPVAKLPGALADVAPGDGVFFGADTAGRRVLCFDSAARVLWQWEGDRPGPYSLWWTGEELLSLWDGRVWVLNGNGKPMRGFDLGGIRASVVAKSIFSWGERILVVGYDPGTGTVFHIFKQGEETEGFGLPGDRAVAEFHPGRAGPVGVSVQGDRLFAVNPFHPKGLLYGNGRFLSQAKIPMTLERATVTPSGALMLRQSFSSAMAGDTVFLGVFVPLTSTLMFFLYSWPRGEILDSLEVPPGYQPASRLLAVEGDWFLLWGQDGIWRFKWK